LAAARVRARSGRGGGGGRARRLELTPSEFKLLSLLAERPGEVFSRGEIMRHLWGSDHVGDEHPADVHVSNLRRKIERNAGRPQLLVTVPGAGYKLDVP
jgi:DNA-binding response OmpR family regulator